MLDSRLERNVKHGEYFMNILEMHNDEMVTMCFITGLQVLFLTPKKPFE